MQKREAESAMSLGFSRDSSAAVRSSTVCGLIIATQGKLRQSLRYCPSKERRSTSEDPRGVLLVAVHMRMRLPHFL